MLVQQMAVDERIGSNFPDTHIVALLEGRAACRISSQHNANWLHHGIVHSDRVVAVIRQVTEIVDDQNASNLAYTPMAPGFEGVAFAAEYDLVFRGAEQPSGYGRPTLHTRRLQCNAQSGSTR